MDNTRVVVIEDEPSIAETIRYALATDGFSPVVCATGGEGLEVLKDSDSALVILDIGLPDINGFELFRRIRTCSSVPVIFLTARSQEIDRVAGLEMGADDYIVKPFSPRELAARVRAVMRRTSAAPPPANTGAAHAQSPAFAIDTERKTITYCACELDLARYEYGILELLVREAGRVFSRRQLMEHVWDEPDVSLERTVDTHIKTLRTKLRAVRPGHDPIVTRRGFGYVLDDSPDGTAEG